MEEEKTKGIISHRGAEHTEKGYVCFLNSEGSVALREPVFFVSNRVCGGMEEEKTKEFISHRGAELAEKGFFVF